MLLCNGLGTPPEAGRGSSHGTAATGWSPGITAAWAGPTGRRTRPVRVEDHTDDARAVLDAFGLEKAAVVGWSLGVNVAFELALENPGRVAGVLAVAGVPGGSYPSLFATYGVPRPLRAPLGRWGSRVLPVVGPLLPVLLASAPPWHDLLVPAATRGPARRPRTRVPSGRCCGSSPATTGPGTATSRSRWPTTRPWTCPGWAAGCLPGGPVRLAGRRGRRPGGGASVPGARFRELLGTHFLPLQYPEVMLAELRAPLRRPAQAGVTPST